jgi:replicative DNA helicase
MYSVADADRDHPVFLRVADLADAYLLAALRPHHRVTLGYPDLDAAIRGVAPGEVMQVLGRSGVGKTAFMLNLVDRMTAHGELPSLIFSLEQQGTEIFERMASLVTGLPAREIEQRARDEDPELVQRFHEVCRRWHHVVVVERPCTVAQLDDHIAAARSSKLWAEPLRLVAVDYIGLLGARRPATPYEQVSEAARELKRLAKVYRVALVSLCQVGREGESGGEPVTLRSGRDSGVLEEAADYVLGIWRPELSDKLAKDERRALAGQFKVRVLKNRASDRDAAVRGCESAGHAWRWPGSRGVAVSFPAHPVDFGPEGTR